MSDVATKSCRATTSHRLASGQSFNTDPSQLDHVFPRRPLDCDLGSISRRYPSLRSNKLLNRTKRSWNRGGVTACRESLCQRSQRLDKTVAQTFSTGSTYLRISKNPQSLNLAKSL